MAKTTYLEKKAEVQAQAIEWQLTFAEHNYSHYDLYEFGNYFYKQGKRYGLLKEFRENGIV